MLQWPIQTQSTTKDEKGNVTIVKPTRWTFSDMVRMMEHEEKLRRLATGQDTDQIKHTGPDGGPVQVQVMEIPFTPEVIESAYRARIKREMQNELENNPKQST